MHWLTDSINAMRPGHQIGGRILGIGRHHPLTEAQDLHRGLMQIMHREWGRAERALFHRPKSSFPPRISKRVTGAVVHAYLFGPSFPG